MGITSRIRRAVTPRTQAQHEHAYLEQAASVFDLERRQREVDEGLLRLRRFGY